jgi:hypothetical protein
MASHGDRHVAGMPPSKEDLMGRQRDQLPPLHRALRAVASLRAGTWESVEALALLAIEAKHLPEGTSMHDAAHAVAAGLKPGTWESVRALACLARADRELAEA